MESVHGMKIAILENKTKRTAIIGLAYVIIASCVLASFYILAMRLRSRSLPSGSVKIMTDYSTYLAGEEVAFSVTNLYSGTIQINNSCPNEPLDVFRLENGVWVRIHDQTANDCEDQDRHISIPANSSVHSSFANWPHLFEKPGKYRIAIYVDYYDSLPYTDFEVIEKPIAPEIPALVEKVAPTITQSAVDSYSDTSVTTPTTTTSQSTTEALSSKTITLSGVGSVYVEYSTSMIYVRSITPASGYLYEGGGSGSRVEITFKGGGNETQLQLSLRNGQLVQKVED